MAAELTRWVWQHSKAAGVDKLVLLAIAEHVNSDGNAWPAVSRLMRYTGLGRSTIHRSLNALVGLGELVVIQQGGFSARGDRRANLYRLNTGSQSGTPLTSRGPKLGPHGVPERDERGPRAGHQLRTEPRTRRGGVRESRYGALYPDVDPADRDTWLGGQLPDE